MAGLRYAVGSTGWISEGCWRSWKSGWTVVYAMSISRQIGMMLWHTVNSNQWSSQDLNAVQQEEEAIHVDI